MRTMSDWSDGTEYTDRAEVKYFKLAQTGKENVILKNQALVHIDEAAEQLRRAQDLIIRIKDLPRMEPFVYTVHSMKTLLDDLWENMDKQFDADMWEHLYDPKVFESTPASLRKEGEKHDTASS